MYWGLKLDGADHPKVRAEYTDPSPCVYCEDGVAPADPNCNQTGTAKLSGSTAAASERRDVPARCVEHDYLIAANCDREEAPARIARQSRYRVEQHWIGQLTELNHFSCGDLASWTRFAILHDSLILHGLQWCYGSTAHCRYEAGLELDT
jgi:hypothetical protein